MAELTAGIAAFLHAAAEELPERELLVLPQWQQDEWQVFFSHARRLNVPRQGAHPGRRVRARRLFRGVGLGYGDFQRYADAHPRQACDLLMAIGRVVASRLRRTQACNAR